MVTGASWVQFKPRKTKIGQKKSLTPFFHWALQLLDEAEYDMQNYTDQGGCYPPKLKAEADNTLRDVQNSSYYTKAEFSNWFTIYSKYFQSFKKDKIYFVELCNKLQISLQILINHVKLENK